VIITLNGREVTLEQAKQAIEAKAKERMQKVRLETSGGDLVAELTIPSFMAPPEVLVWGNRVFAQEPGTENTYSEVFAYVVPDAA
jgi:hypothetical protein